MLTFATPKADAAVRFGVGVGVAPAYSYPYAYPYGYDPYAYPYAYATPYNPYYYGPSVGLGFGWGGGGYYRGPVGHYAAPAYHGTYRGGGGHVGGGYRGGGHGRR
jgi:hypothetical protein